MTDVILKNCKPALSYISTALADPVKIRRQEGDPDPITVPQLFESTVRKFSDHTALVKQDAERNWITYTYQEYWNKTRQVARAFVKLGLEPRSACGILAMGSPEWFVTHMATIMVGGVSAGIYMTNSAEVVHHILFSSGATICVVDDSVQMDKVRSIMHRLPELKSVIQLQGPFGDFVDMEEGFYSWSRVEAIGACELGLEEEVEKRLSQVAANECASLIYTSGTVGMPKGVMLSHDNCTAMAHIVVKSWKDIDLGHEVIVSYLPLNHVAGQLFDIFIGLNLGATVYFADRNALKGTLIKTLSAAQPTRFLGVPRIYEKIQEKLIAAENAMPWVSRMILTTARNTVENYHLAEMKTGHKSSYSLSYWLASKVTQKIRTALGFSQYKIALVGSAPSSPELKRFFLSYGIKCAEVYGLSEVSGCSNANWDLGDLESCGNALDGFELKFNDPDENGHGELCLRGRTIFMGYLHDPEKTKEALFDDGWFHTGDIGYLDSKGCLFITGRLKELLVTSGGENIPPAHIEMLVLQELPGLSNCILIGDKRKFLSMLVAIKTEIDPDTGRPLDQLQNDALDWMRELDLPYVTLKEILHAGPCPKVIQSIEQGIKRANANALSNAQKVQKFAILPHDFTIPTGELGPTLKLRRNVVIAKYAHIIETFYKDT